MIQFDDLTILGETIPPPRLIKALAVIAKHLHREFDRNKSLVTGISKRSCVLSSLAVKEFLEGVGIEAMVCPTAFVIRAYENQTELHSLGIGHPVFKAPDRGGWDGHLVTLAGNWLIDTTLYQTIRPAWRGHITGMMAVQIDRGEPIAFSESIALTPIGAAGVTDNSYNLCATWFENPANNRWVTGQDAVDKDRRIKVVKRLIQKGKLT